MVDPVVEWWNNILFTSPQIVNRKLGLHSISKDPNSVIRIVDGQIGQMKDQTYENGKITKTMYSVYLYTWIFQICKVNAFW